MPAHSMTDQQFHEIQLSGKQLVFVFISAVGVAVVIFLLGVSVGRGVRSTQPAVNAAAGATGDTSVAAASPPAASKSGDLTYHDVLTGKDGKAAPPPVAAPPPPAPAAAPQTAPAATPPAPEVKLAEAKKTPPPATADAKPPTKAAPAETKAAASGPLFLQFGGYNSKENAESHVQQLKAQGFTAFVFQNTGPGPRFRVRMGPYADKAEADKQAARLSAAGQKPFITR
jgi:DedD protein